MGRRVAPGSGTDFGRWAKLVAVKERGLLTDAQFEAAKARILGVAS